MDISFITYSSWLVSQLIHVGRRWLLFLSPLLGFQPAPLLSDLLVQHLGLPPSYRERPFNKGYMMYARKYARIIRIVYLLVYTFNMFDAYSMYRCYRMGTKHLPADLIAALLAIIPPFLTQLLSDTRCSPKPSKRPIARA